MSVEKEEIKQSIEFQEISPLYFLLEKIKKGVSQQDQKAAGEILKNTTVEFSAIQDAFYIKILNLNTFLPVFPIGEFDCVDRHLALNKAYCSNEKSEKAFGFTIAHYTEKYQKRQEGVKDFYKVRLYLNHFGYVLGVTIKYYQNDQDKQGALQQISDRAKIFFKQNAVPFIDFLKQLSHEYKKRLDTLEQKINKIDEQLCTLSKGFPNTIKKYEQKVSEFKKLIEEMNRLKTDTVDKRDQYVDTILHRAKEARNLIEAHKLKSKQREKDALNLADEQSQETETTEQEVIKDSEYEKQVDSIKKEIIKLTKFIKFKENTKLQHLLEKREKIDMLNEAIINFYCFSIQEKTEIVKKAEKNIQFLKIKVNQLYQEALLKGDVSIVQKLFPIVEKQGNIYKELLEKVCNTLDDPKQPESLKENLISVCDFLLKNFQMYSYFLNFFFNEVGMYVANEPFCFFKMLDLMCNNKIKAFSFFLEQGVDPNGFAVIFSGNTISLLKFSISYLPEFAKLLIEKGALIEGWSKWNIYKSIDNIDNEKKVSKLENMRIKNYFKKIQTDSDISLSRLRQNQRHFNNQFYFSNREDFNEAYKTLQVPSCLYLAAKHHHQDLVKQMLFLTDLAQIAFSLANYSNIKNIVSGHVKNVQIKKSGLFYFPSKQARDDNYKFFLSAQEKAFAMVFFPVSGASPKLGQILQILVVSFQEKLKKASFKKIQNAVLKLFHWYIEVENMPKQIVDIHLQPCCLIGIFYLLIKQHNQFLQKCETVDFDQYFNNLNFLRQNLRKHPEYHKRIPLCEQLFSQALENKNQREKKSTQTKAVLLFSVSASQDNSPPTLDLPNQPNQPKKTKGKKKKKKKGARAGF